MQAGQQLHHYRLIEKIGEGGMGVVWKAEDTRLHRHVALKLVPEAKERQGAVDRHLREARAASALNHPNICAIHDIGEWEGRRFIVMELLEGVPLQQRIGRTPLDVDTAIDLAIQISDALAAAHAKEIVHRDIKPANVVVNESDSGPHAKILDFGLAKLGGDPLEAESPDDETRTALDQTQPGHVMGTVSYMSPEQALGKPLDHRSDIFSLGVVLYEMLTGRRAFKGDTSAAVFDAILNRAPVAPIELNSAVPAEVERIVNRALEKDPALRYQSAADLAADLRRLRRDTTTSHPVPREANSGKPWGPLGIGALAILIVAVVAAWQFRGKDAASDPETTVVSSAISGISIAVLPFVNASGDPDQRYFSDGLTNDIVTELSRYGELAVLPCASAECAISDANAREIGESLGVRYVLQGQVQSTDQRIRVNVQLSDGADGRSIWGNSYVSERTARDLFDLQDELTQQVVQAVAGSYGVIARTELPRARRKPPENLASHDCIFRVYQYLQLHFPDNHRAARDCLEHVVETEPDYVDGLAWLAYLYVDQFHHRWYEPGEVEYDSRRRALEVAERAVRLDDGNHLAHAYLGMAALFNGDRARGIAEMHRAYELHPNHASTLTLLGNYLAYQGDFEAAVPIARKAIALTPNPPEYIEVPLFLDHYFYGRYEEALVHSEAGIVANDDDFREPLFLAATYGQLGRIDEARPVLEKLLELWARPTGEIRHELIERHALAPHIADRLIEGLAKAGLEGL